MTNTTITITVSVPDEHLNDPNDDSFVRNLDEFVAAMAVNNYEHTITICWRGNCECGEPITRTTKYRGFETI